jgi:teichuronic acid biosynthesis glycosyltransferase TuaC
MMKVLTVSHMFPNPLEPFKGVFVAEISSALQKFVEIRVAAPLSWFPFLRPQREIPHCIEHGGVSVHHPRYLALPKPLRDVRWLTYQYALDRVLGDLKKEEFRPDILHAHWLYPDGLAAAKAARRIGAKSVVTIHGHASLGLGIRGLATPKCREALHLVDFVIAVSEELKELLMTRFGVEAERIRVLHNGINPEKFAIRDRESARRTLGLPLNRPIMLCVARLSEEKQVHLLVEAISRLPDPALQTFVIGEGPLRRDLQDLIHRKGLQNRIILTGGVAHESLADWYFSADLFCLTSAHEGCPVVVHESLACGVPVVSTPVGAVPDLVHPGENGMLTQPNAESIAFSIQSALHHDWNRSAIAAAGQHHSWHGVARRTVSEYEDLLRHR